MAITASSPDAFFDGEDFAFDFTVTNADGSPQGRAGMMPCRLRWLGCGEG